MPVREISCGRNNKLCSVLVTSDDLPLTNPTPSMLHPRYLLSIGASVEAENESGEKPADLIDPDCKELVKMFEVGAV